MTASAAGHALVGTPACMPRDVGIPCSLVRAQSQTVRSLDAVLGCGVSAEATALA
jgi:hypothetical protein